VSRREIYLAEVSDQHSVSLCTSNPTGRWLDDNGEKAGFRPIIS
jgi:hypothetical protein